MAFEESNMPVQTCAPTSYRIEVSGWDSDQNFFVEKTALEWSELRKVVLLRRCMDKGATIFVRLLSDFALDDSYPLAYEILQVNYQHETRIYHIVLAQLHPLAQVEADAAR